MKRKLSKEIRNMSKHFALIYPQLKEAIIAFEKYKTMNNHISTKRESEYLMRKRHIEIIETAFKKTVSESNQKKAWDYFYKKKAVASYEKADIDKEIEEWLYCMAKELGITTDF